MAPLGRVAIFIDGGHLDHVRHREFAGQEVDYHLLAREMACGHEPLRTYYYTCPPYQSNPPTEDEAWRTATHFALSSHRNEFERSSSPPGD